MQPESSDGFASVGTVLPGEEAALLPGGLFLSRLDSSHREFAAEIRLPQTAASALLGRVGAVSQKLIGSLSAREADPSTAFCARARKLRSG